jgi:hypothetical protein
MSRLKFTILSFFWNNCGQTRITCAGISIERRNKTDTPANLWAVCGSNIDNLRENADSIVVTLSAAGGQQGPFAWI